MGLSLVLYPFCKCARLSAVITWYFAIVYLFTCLANWRMAHGTVVAWKQEYRKSETLKT